MDAFIPLLEKLFVDANPARFAESLVLLAIAWWRVKAAMSDHLTKIETSLEKLSKAVSDGFSAGERRFGVIEGRLLLIETKNGSDMGAAYKTKGEV